MKGAAIMAAGFLLAATFTLLARDYSRAMEQCERLHSRATCQHILR